MLSVLSGASPQEGFARDIGLRTSLGLGRWSLVDLENSTPLRAEYPSASPCKEECTWISFKFFQAQQARGLFTLTANPMLVHGASLFIALILG